MKKLLRVIIYPIILLYAIVVFSPKEELFFLAEEFLEKEKVVLSNEERADFGLLFKLKKATFFYDSIKAGNIDELSFLCTIFYNRVNLKNFQIHKDFKDFFPGNIASIEAQQVIYKPHIIDLKGDGAFGSLTGSIDLVKREIKVVLQASSIMSRKYQQLLRGFRKTKEGYVYEQRF